MPPSRLQILVLSPQAEDTQFLAGVLSPFTHQLTLARANLEELPPPPGRDEPPMVAVLCLNDLAADQAATVGALARAAPWLPVVVLSQSPGLDEALAVLAAGAQQCLDRQGLSPEALWRALHSAATLQGVRERIRSEAERCHSIINAQSQLIWRFAPEGRLTLVNEAFARYFGRSARELVGSDVFALLTADSRPELGAALADITATHPGARVDLAVLGPKGDPRRHHWALQGIYTEQGELLEFQSVGVDITERQMVEKALQTAEANLRHLIVSNSDGLVVVDPEGGILFLNPAAEDMLGGRAFELVGTRFPHPLDTQEPLELNLTPRPGEEIIVEMRVVETQWEQAPAYLASIRDVTEIVRLREELRSMSLVDPLTGIFNRRGFMTVARQQLKTAQRMGRRLILCFVDLDNLKQVNDTLGHRHGDQALRETAMILRATFRESDIIARVGGDEFAVLAIAAEKEDLGVIRERLERNLRDWNNDTARPYRLGMSVGYSQCDPAIARTIEEMLTEADERMYRDKRAKGVDLDDLNDL